MLQEKVAENRKGNREKSAIVVSNVTKEFIIPHERKTTLFENINGAFRPSTYEKFTALKNVSFSVEKGESIGIIGANGSGKSTLLKIISKIIRPTNGTVRVNGHITPFLELGVGFQQDMTARENIEVYSSIMGLSAKEIAKNMDSVLEFAGLERFKDTKLKNLSSGMQVRLAFATAIQIKPEILLIDEVLAVGDIDFQQKCLESIRKYKEEGATIVMVSHDLNAIRRFCEKSILLQNGEIVSIGDTSTVIDKYVYKSLSTVEEAPIKADAAAQEPQTEIEVKTETVEEKTDVTVKADSGLQRKIEICDVKFIDKYGNNNTRFNSRDHLTIRIFFRSIEKVMNPIFGIGIYSEQGNLLYGTNTDLKKYDINYVSGEGHIDMVIDKIPMMSGKYLFTVAAHSRDNQIYHWVDKEYSFEVMSVDGDIGIFGIDFKWTLSNHL